MAEKLRVTKFLSGVSLLALSSCLVTACGSDAPTTPGAAGSGHGAAGASGAAPSGGAAGTAGGGAGPVGSGGAPAASGAGGETTGGQGGSGQGGASGGAGAPTTAGAGGQAACASRPTGTERKAPAFPATTITNPAGLLFRFMNNCPMKLWVKSSGLPGGVVELASKATADYDITGAGIHGRVEAFKGAAPGAAGSVEMQFTEMNADKDKAFNVNLSHVDWVGLPVEIKGIGPSPDCGVTACYQPLANLLTGCPAQLLDTNEGKCRAPNSYCGEHATEDFCKTLMASAANTLANDPDCAAGKNATFTPNDIFGCAGYFGGGDGKLNGNACCAKVNRNWQGNATAQKPTDRCSFYKNAPFNVYADWAQKQCPYIYAFAYDDVADQSGFFTCTKGTEMDITYCPGDP